LVAYFAHEGKGMHVGWITGRIYNVWLSQSVGCNQSGVCGFG
jgi:hypothetical protein